MKISSISKNIGKYGKIKDVNDKLEKIEYIKKNNFQPYSVELFLYSTYAAHQDQKHSYTKKGKIYYLITNPTREFRVHAQNPFPNDLYRKFIPKHYYEDGSQIGAKITDEFKRLNKIMETDKEYDELTDKRMDYIEAIYVKHYDSFQSNRTPYKPLK